MVGYGTNKGIVPIACDEIFKRIDEVRRGPDASKYQFQVTIQMLEIYNEQVRDLFAKDNPSGGLKVRMNPKTGVEVVGLSEWPVASYAEIDERIETATKNRTVAATQMNATSSRAHTVVTICYTQLEIDAKGPGKHSEKKAKMNLVDLAGSERAESTGATGDRLKEGAAINLSLTMLGNVITALAEKSNNPKKNVLVPYRESKLTTILQDALGGNAKTIMICALSPADINYDETLSTLRYADRAKQIKNKPKVNMDPTEALIQQLKAENERLKAQVGGVAPAEGGPMSEEEKEAIRKQLEEEMQAKLLENQRMIDEMNKSWEQKLQEAQARAAEEGGPSEGGGGSRSAEAQRRATEPHLLNIHEDPLLSRAVCHFLAVGKTRFGSRSQPDGEEVLLGGPSVKPNHCYIMNEEGGGELKISAREGCKVLVNGAEASSAGLPLKHNDRLFIGSNYCFVLVHPSQSAAGPPEGGEWPEVDWDFANREMAKAQGLSVDVNWSTLSEEERRRALLNDELIQVMPRVAEANDISKEMGRGVTFETKILPVLAKKKGNTGSGTPTSGMTSAVMVRVFDAARDLEWFWGKNKFVNRVYLMRELFEKFEEAGRALEPPPEDQDPFWDPNEPVCVSHCSVHLKPLSYCLQVEDDFALYRDVHQDGVLHVKLEPCRPDGSPVLETDDSSPYDEIEDPKDLVGRRLDVLVSIPQARGVNTKYDKEVFVRFHLPQVDGGGDGGEEDDDGFFQTEVIKGTSNPDFKYVKQVTWMRVNEELLQTFLEGAAIFQVNLMGWSDITGATSSIFGAAYLVLVQLGI
mmetsp:Transcript_88562/g.235695  ORF Transcript_88562/g.235695 Transcript_88562/m.235695 type:complete len:807 (+) Transcript_88562:469-2889(+)